jgi:hypothetical protein
MKYLECNNVVLMRPNSTGTSQTQVGVSPNGTTLLVNYPGFILQAGSSVGQTLVIYVSINGTIKIGVNIITNQVIKVLWSGTTWIQAF